MLHGRHRVRALITALAIVSGACDSVSSPIEAKLEATRSELRTAEIPAASSFTNPDEKWAQIARTTVPGFAGTFLDEHGNSVVYLLNPTQKAAAAQLIASFRHEKGLAPAPIIVRQADYDFAQLRDWFTRLQPLVVTKDRMVMLDIDETKNRLWIGVTDDASIPVVQAELDARRVPRNAVEVDVVPPPELRTTLRDLQRPAQGGYQIASEVGICTLGFNVQHYMDGVWRNAFVTASHCSSQLYGLDYSDSVPLIV